MQTNDSVADGQRDIRPTASASIATADGFPLPTYDNVVTASSLVKQAVAAKRREQSALGANGALDRLPELDAFDGALARGISPPRVPGYDLMFQLKHGEHPFTSPSAHASLATSRIPFTFRTASYDLASRSLRAGQLPPTDEVRVEDFLAAQEYILPPAPAGGLMLYAAGSVSPLGSDGLHLLDLTVQAAAHNARAHAPVRLIVAMDTSSQMRGGARWEAVRRALAKLARAMNDSDRLTLIGSAEQSRVLAYNSTRHELQTWLESDALPTPTGSANVALAIESASTAARAGQSRAATRLIVITGDRNDINEADLPTSTRALAELADGGIAWQIVRVATSDGGDQWSQLARAAHGKVTPAPSAAEIYDALLENLAGHSTTVAGGATLKLTFNPQVVTGYRLLGHDSTTITGPSADPLSIDLHADQTATGLYELWIKPGGDALVATAELTWNDPKGGQPRRIVRPLVQSQMNGSFSNAPPWFQQGVIAAKVAETLRRSHFAPASHPLVQVLDLSRQVDPRVAELPQFQHLVGLLKLAEKLREARPSAALSHGRGMTFGPVATILLCKCPSDAMPTGCVYEREVIIC